VNLDNKSQAYLDAMYDTILDEDIKKSVNVDNVSFSTEKTKSDSSIVDVNASRLKMMEDQKNAHKKGAK